MPNTTIRQRDHSLISFFGLTYGITWGLAALLVLFPTQVAVIFGPMSAANPLFILAVAGPTIAASILTLARDGWAGLRTLYARMGQWGFGARWYALLLLGLPLVIYIAAQVGGPQPRFHADSPAMLIGYLALNFLLGPLGEELGWRGFALPRLLERLSPLVASLVLGAIWGVWHLPAFFVAGLPQTSMALPAFLVGTLFLSTLATWFFLRTGGSVPSVVLFHYIANIAQDLFGPPQPAFTIAIGVVAALVVLLDRRVGWLHSGAAAAYRRGVSHQRAGQAATE